MTLKFQIGLLLTFVQIFQTLYGQSISKKDLADKLNIILNLDSLKTGDTVLIKKGEQYNNYYFKSNTDLKQYTWYMK